MLGIERGVGRRLVAAGLVMCVGLLAACSTPPPLPAEASAGSRAAYVIGVTDTLLVKVWKNVELGGQVVVRSDGMISVPLLDDIQAEGLTAEELKEVITEALTEYVTDPDVTVIVTGMNSNTVSIMGGVLRSGEFPLQKEMRVLQAIARSGGFSLWAKRDKVRILRPTQQGLVEYRFDYDAYLSGKAPGTNLVLVPGDTIVVPD